jgi:GWxTD domain-containing protein
MKKYYLIPLFILVFFGTGCASKGLKIDPTNPVFTPKNDFEMNYGFFITEDERKKGYSAENNSKFQESISPFNQINTLEEFNKFEKIFWQIRDTDPNTPQNEYKDIIDQRISDIKNEIFFTDIDTPGTSFKRNGGLRGEMARVYLLHGAPSFKDRLPENHTSNRSELIVWYYIDVQGRHLFRFLFYEKYGKMELFKNPSTLFSYEILFNPLSSPLREISMKAFPTSQELMELWMGLDRDDPQWIFRTPLIEFTDYTTDIVMEGGDDKKIGALDPPEPVALAAVRYKPTILGQPGDLSNRNFVFNLQHSFIPVYFRIGYPTGKPVFSILTSCSNLDWEHVEDKMKSVLTLRMSFQNKTTRAIREYFVRLTLTVAKDFCDQKGTVVIYLNEQENFAPQEKNRGTLGDLVNSLESGIYVLNVDLQHVDTKKSAGGWREEITIK